MKKIITTYKVILGFLLLLISPMIFADENFALCIYPNATLPSLNVFVASDSGSQCISSGDMGHLNVTNASAKNAPYFFNIVFKSHHQTCIVNCYCNPNDCCSSSIFSEYANVTFKIGNDTAILRCYDANNNPRQCQIIKDFDNYHLMPLNPVVGNICGAPSGTNISVKVYIGKK